MYNSERQRYGRNKQLSINHAYIESGEYRRKFDMISQNPQLNRIIFDLCKKSLIHRSGTLFEDMYWIDTDTLEIIASVTDSKISQEVRYTKSIKKAIKMHKHILTIHSHPMSGPPSIDDFNSNYSHEYELGVICCHDGRVYVYKSEQFVSPMYYKLKLAQQSETDFNQAQLNVLAEIKKDFAISYKEVIV